MLRSALAAAAAAAFLAGAGAAHAHIFTFDAFLAGTEEVPANASPASGFSLVTLDDVADTLTVDENWTDLIGGNAAAAHIHCCTPHGTNIGVAVPFVGFPASPSGTYLHTFNLMSASTYTASFLNNFGGGTAAGAEIALVNGLMAGTAYANIHDATFPGGEIRGFLSLTPEPATWASMLLGFALAGAAIRRRGFRPAAT
jgi:hypothetical protein